jgi:hypothetical protein
MEYKDVVQSTKSKTVHPNIGLTDAVREGDQFNVSQKPLPEPY